MTNKETKRQLEAVMNVVFDFLPRKHRKALLLAHINVYRVDGEMVHGWGKKVARDIIEKAKEIKTLVNIDWCCEKVLALVQEHIDNLENKKND